MDVQQLYKESLAEVERLLQNKNVVGDPIQIGDTTLIPLSSIGFGFGAGGGQGAPAKDVPEGVGGGTGGGGGMKPVALIVIDKEGTRVERIEGPSGLAKMGEAIAQAMQERQDADVRVTRSGPSRSSKAD